MFDNYAKHQKDRFTQSTVQYLKSKKPSKK